MNFQDEKNILTGLNQLYELIINIIFQISLLFRLSANVP